jgi:hypothetical protein
MTPVPASAFRCNPKQTPFRYVDVQSKGESSSALTYARAKQLCSSQGQRLCSAAELCRQGRPRPGLDKFGRTDNWIAVDNAPNEWVTFTRAHNRLCKTHTQIAGSTPAWGTQSNARGQGIIMNGAVSPLVIGLSEEFQYLPCPSRWLYVCSCSGSSSSARDSLTFTHYHTDNIESDKVMLPRKK